MNSNENKAIVNDFERKIGLLVKELEDMINHKVLGIGLEFGNVISIQGKETSYLKAVKIVLEPEEEKRVFRVGTTKNVLGELMVITVLNKKEERDLEKFPTFKKWITNWIEY